MEKLIHLKVNTSRFYTPNGYTCYVSSTGWINSINDGGKVFTGLEWTDQYEVIGYKRGYLDFQVITPV